MHVRLFCAFLELLYRVTSDKYIDEIICPFVHHRVS